MSNEPRAKSNDIEAACRPMGCVSPYCTEVAEAIRS